MAAIQGMSPVAGMARSYNGLGAVPYIGAAGANV